jgi:cytochrome oxidase Cu insertion factor (SCO1/SenC/PrrC family)
VARRNKAAAVGRGAQEAKAGQQHQKISRGAAGPRPRRAAVVAVALLIGLAILGGVIWLAGQRSTAEGPVGGVAVGQAAPGRGLALPATRGGSLSLQQLSGRKVVLYFYEGST